MAHSHETLSTQQSYSKATPPRKDARPLAAARAVLEDVFGSVASRRFAVRFWDGSLDEPAEEPRFTIVLESPGSLRRMLLPPSELTLTESYIFGDVDIEGNLEAAADLGDIAASRLRSPRALLRLARHVLALPRDERPGEEDKEQAGSPHLSGRRHSTRRDREAVRFHYNVGNAFYALWLDARMVYSCAYFAHEIDDLDRAQESKLDLICRKLRLKPGERLLDIGCGWGGLIMHAARRYGVVALGITLSDAQAELARERIAAAGLSDRCKVELRDYRELVKDSRLEPFDKLASVGMIEHVGRKRLSEYFTAAYAALRPGGLFLNHGIDSIQGSRPESIASRTAGRLWQRGEFIDRYVFPDGELLPSALVIATAERSGFELRDVESLREHYWLTLRHWVRRLEARRREAIELVGETTYRVWRLYMSASAYGFRTGRIGIIQSLLAKPHADGRVELPRTRADVYR